MREPLLSCSSHCSKQILRILIALTVAGCYFLKVSCFVAQQRKNNARFEFRATTSLHEARTNRVRYSPTFQRHVVYTNISNNTTQQQQRVLASFEFLDEAQRAFPDAELLSSSSDQHQVAGGGIHDYYDAAKNQDSTTDPVESLQTLASLAVGGSSGGAAETSLQKFLQERVGLDRFERVSVNQLQQNYVSLGSILNETLAQSVVANFPLVCLYDPKCVAERLQCFLQPLPPNETPLLDWPLLCSRGYGLGWTKQQLSQALGAVPHVVLAMSRDDVAALQPTLLYYYQVLQVSYPQTDETRLALEEYVNGATVADVCTFAYLRSLGVTWEQLQYTLQAFPMLVVCDSEPTWEMLDPRGNVRTVLKQRNLHYLCSRLQIRPGQVQAMLKTHFRLSTYSLEGKIRPTLDVLQTELGFASRELQQLVLRMPSILGMSIQNSTDVGLFQRLKFFHEEVGMTRDQLRVAILKQPSLLQYSVDDSLRPKLSFLVDNLEISRDSLPYMIVAQPILMGLSLENRLRLTAIGISEHCDMSLGEVGIVIERAPVIFALSWKRNLLPKLRFLQERLGLSKTELKLMIMTTPRLLCQSIRNSLEPKLNMIETALATAADGPKQRLVPDVVTASPSMLVTTNGELERRLQKSIKIAASDPVARSRALISPSNRGASRKKRIVLELDTGSGNVTNEFTSAKAAAKELGTSLPNMYNVCNTGRLWKGRKYVYAEPKTASDTEDTQGVRPAVSSTATTTLEPPQTKPATRNKKKPLVFLSLKGALSTVPYPSNLSDDDSITSNTVRILVYASGKVYPPDHRSQVRGTRRAGGIALYFPQVHAYQGGPGLALILRKAAELAFAQIMTEATFYEDGILLAGFPYLRPSRNRCDLYACHDALKFLLQLLKQHDESSSLLQDSHVHMDVCTDSDYAWNLLHNVTRVHRWGSIEQRHFQYDGEGPASRANPDLLHPLCRTYYRLIEQQDLQVAGSSSAATTSSSLSRVVAKVSIAFHHAAATTTKDDKHVDMMKWLHQQARTAAAWQYQRAKTAKW